MVQSVRYVDAREKAASVAYPISTYEVVFSREPGMLPVPDEITRRRKNKKEKVLVVRDYLVEGFRFDEADPCRARFSLEAHNEGSLRPDLFIEECISLYHEDPRNAGEPLEARSITRVGQRAV